MTLLDYFRLKTWEVWVALQKNLPPEKKETHSINAENSLNYFCVDGKNNWEEKVLFILVLPLSGLLCITRSGKTKISTTNQVELKYSPAW